MRDMSHLTAQSRTVEIDRRGFLLRMDTPRSQLVAERERAVAQLERLRRDHAAIVEVVQLDRPDDEHDPDGATLGWERQQLAALIRQVETRVAGIDHALARVDADTWGRCEACGDPIGEERLAARPSARTCITCAT